MSTSRELIKLWRAEKEHYKKTEVGTGVQSFVKKVLESEIFNLKEGKLSAKTESRKNEFIHEKRAKESRKADFYIYINSNIAIPVEVECFGNIKAGEKQLLNYQKDFDKRYGILTDGFDWRFYNNNAYKTFYLNEVLENAGLFPTFWKEYVKPEFYYLSFFEKTGQLALLEETKLHVEVNRQLFFEDITKLIQSFNNKLQIEGYLEGEDKKTRARKAIELTYAYVIQFILYKTLVDNEFDNFYVEFNDTVAKIHESLNTRRYKDILGIIEGISAKISKNVYRPFTKEQEFIQGKIHDLYHSLENNLSDVSPWLDVFIFIKKYNFSNVKNEIFGYIYENYLKELYEESKKGQYFTDPAIVNFMLEQIGYTPEIVKQRCKQNHDSISIVDPSCGSGTFLYSATDSIIRAFQDGNTEEASKKIEEAVTGSVFGLDIEEFPLYLAEMSVLMRMLALIINERYNNPIDKKIKVFKTRDSISEFLDTAIRNTFSDMHVAFQKAAPSNLQQALFINKIDLGYTSYVRDEDDLREMKRSLENHSGISRRRFDFVVGNPPYISYNESAKQGIRIFELMKKGRAKLSDIYGLNLHSVPNNQKKYSPKPNLYAFFIALGLALLKDGGKLCFIIPQTILTAGDLDVIRYHLAKFTTIEKITTFSGKMFVGRGLKQNKPVPTSSLIFVVSRKTPESLHQVETIHYTNPDDDIETCLVNISKGKNTINKTVLQLKLLNNLSNWNLILHDKITLDLIEAYKEHSEDISIYYSHAWAEQQFKSRFYFDIGFSLNQENITMSKGSDGYLGLIDFRRFTGYSNFQPDEYYPDDRARIKLTQNSQGYKTLDVQNKIIWSVKNPDKFYFTTKRVIFPMGKASIICSDNKDEIEYLLALLNSPVSSLVLNSLAKNVNEKEFLVPIRAIKEFIRVPKINATNQKIKEEIIKKTDEILRQEDVTLSDLVEFREVLKQKFDYIGVEDNNIVLRDDDNETKLPIKRDVSLVTETVRNHYGDKDLGLDGKTITLQELMTLPAIDFKRQGVIKDQIDDLVFCLYFNILVPQVKFSDAKLIKELCQTNRFYDQIAPKSAITSATR